MSPGGGYSTQYCSGGIEQNGMFTSLPTSAATQHNMNVFPSMSVNVSMNMTMHGYPPPMNPDNLHAQMSCQQVSKNKILSIIVYLAKLISAQKKIT